LTPLHIGIIFFEFNNTILNNWLCIASINGHKAIVELLLAKGAEIENKDNNGWTALHEGIFFI
jgi:ankyrin repeat protein